MAAERPDKPKKKEKKERRSDEAGVAKAKKDRKEKLDKKEKLAAAVEGSLRHGAAPPAPARPGADDDDDDDDADDDGDAGAPRAGEAAVPLERAVVSFAVPVADDKGIKKVYKTIRKAAKNGTLKRGVKEVVKALRKSPAAAPGNTSFPGVVVVAGDISPHDVISHLPVLCEDHNVPFIFVTSRAELGAAAKTKRPTSVVMVMERREPAAAAAKRQPPAKGDGGDDDKDDAEAFADAYASLAKYVQKEYARQGFWARGDSRA